VSPSAEDFRKRADECYRLSTRLRNPEHTSFALYLAAAWLALAEQAARKQAVIDSVISPPPPDDQPKDHIK